MMYTREQLVEAMKKYYSHVEKNKSLYPKDNDFSSMKEAEDVVDTLLKFVE